ncbi:uncharacterized protein LOC122087678 [Macadamia integrifolia]|uniref:uncharacterized protein LOC122087678 n=1 Tax=Macadamia integrifolia TaxID=60698 RepID=UPI001C4FA518|nr:uncharacterized protein LOC122087678 [Macadamia integrifolia]
MACSPSSILCLATLVIAGILFSGEQSVVMAQRKCRGDVQGLMKQCMQFVEKGGPLRDPSQSCCAVLKNSDVTCMCGIIPPRILPKISSAKVAHAAYFCGNPIPAGVKCGS